MDKEIHRLEKLLQNKEEAIIKLNTQVKQLQQKLSQTQQQALILKMQANNSFSYKNVPDREIIQTLEAKLASSSWQIQQLQRINMKYQENLIKLQSILLSQEQEFGMKKLPLETINLKTTQNDFQEMEVIENLRQLERHIKQKEGLIDENLKLKNRIREMESELKDKMAFYINEVANFSGKIKNQHENQKLKLTQFQNIIKEFKKDNDQLRQHLTVKNQQMILFYDEMKMISTDKLSDMHTIRNLRKEIKKKGEQFYKVLLKLGETEEIKKKLVEYSSSCSQSLGEFNKLVDQFEETKRQNGVLKEKLKQKQQKWKKDELLIQQNNKKLYELLVENEACHKLLYEARGYSNLFAEDIDQKITQFLNCLEKRRQSSTTWLDVTDLIAVNQKMRLGNYIFENQIV